ncbi:MAG: protein kinase [Labilithrix sp.]|nr:protein kinase [Labilithrix sp.]
MRELGARAQRSYAAIREPHELVVVHRFARRAAGGAAVLEGATVLAAEELGLLLRDAQCLAKNWHPNIARIKHVDLVGGDLTLASELVDGATLADLSAIAAGRGAALPLDVLVRVLLDVLAGLHGLHGLRDNARTPIGAVHGELCPANVVVGRDGVARLVNALRPRPLTVAAGSEGVGYAAPETLDRAPIDARADVHAAGVILWEALTGKRLHDERDPARVLARQREVDIARPALPPGSPYQALADIAMRALAFDPALRFRTATEMASELRKLPAARIATGSVVAGWVNEVDGDRIRGRRAALDPTSSGSRRRASSQSIVAMQAKPAASRTAEAPQAAMRRERRRHGGTADAKAPRAAERRRARREGTRSRSRSTAVGGGRRVEVEPSSLDLEEIASAPRRPLRCPARPR